MGTESPFKELVDVVAGEADLTKGQSIKMERALNDVFEKGMALKDALGISSDSIEGIYAHAYRLYQAAKYTDAGHIFRLLQTLNPKDSRFYFGMAACAHRQEKYEVAIFLYEVTAEFDKQNPMPLYYASDCKMKLGRFKGVYDALKRVVDRCLKKPEYRSLMERSLMTMASLKDDITEEEEAKKKELQGASTENQTVQQG